MSDHEGARQTLREIPIDSLLSQIDDWGNTPVDECDGKHALCGQLLLVAAKEHLLELQELQQTFDLIKQAYSRARDRWQNATGKTLTWPDTADLVVWLLEQLEAKESRPD